MKLMYYLIYSLYFVQILCSEDLQKFLTKKNSKLWFQNQTQTFQLKNPYCSICCVDVRQQQKGRKCGLHTMCIYNPDSFGASCRGPIVMNFSRNEIDAIIDIHNTLRNKIAMGFETEGDPGPQPSAANMRIMSWDDELAIVAYRWALQCVYSYDRCRDLPRFPVGQNIAKANYASKSVLEDILGWYELVQFVSKVNIIKYILNKNDNMDHYTQLVWADTYLVGCARICFQNAVGGLIIYREHFICNYGPSGNIPGQPVYKIGEPCSACLVGTGCTNPEYPALCGNELIDEANFTTRRKKHRTLKKKYGNQANRTFFVNINNLMFSLILNLHILFYKYVLILLKKIKARHYGDL